MKKILIPIIIGIIVIVGIFVFSPIENAKTELYATNIIAECERDKNCLVEMMWQLSNKENQQTVLTTVGDIMSVYQQEQFYCHQQAHHLGMFLYSYTTDLSEALLSADRKCGGSLYHGIMESFFMSEDYRSKDADDIQITKLCDVLGIDPIDIIRLECVHGIGHGLAKSLNYDVFSAVERCDEFDETTEQTYCYHGIFMENSQEYFDTQGGNFDPDDVMYPCNRLDDKYVAQCYYYHTTYILKKTNSVTESFNECNQLKSPFIENCYQGIGRGLSLFYLDNMDGLIDICKSGLLEYQPHCFMGGLILIADQMGMDAVFETCSLLQQQIKSCYYIAGKLVPEDEREKECSKTESVYFKACMGEL